MESDGSSYESAGSEWEKKQLRPCWIMHNSVMFISNHSCYVHKCSEKPKAVCESVFIRAKQRLAIISGHTFTA